MIFGVSFDAPKNNRAFALEQEFPFQLLCDTDRKLSLAYGACATVSDPFPRRITYLISPEGRIEQALETEDPGTQAAQILESL